MRSVRRNCLELGGEASLHPRRLGSFGSILGVWTALWSVFVVVLMLSMVVFVRPGTLKRKSPCALSRLRFHVRQLVFSSPGVHYARARTSPSSQHAAPRRLFVIGCRVSKTLSKAPCTPPQASYTVDATETRPKTPEALSTAASKPSIQP